MSLANKKQTVAARDKISFGVLLLVAGRWGAVGWGGEVERCVHRHSKQTITRNRTVHAPNPPARLLSLLKMSVWQ